MDRAPKRNRLPSVASWLTVGATLAAGWMLGSSFYAESHLLDGLRHRDPTVRLKAMEELVSRGTESVPSFVVALSDPDPNIRLRGLYGLQKLGSEASVAEDAVRRLLFDEIPDVRSAAINSLIMIKSDDPIEIIQFLITMLEDTNPSVKQTAMRGLESIGHRWRPPMYELLRSDNQMVREFAFRFFRNTPNTIAMSKSIEMVRPLLDDEDPDIRQTALLAIIHWNNVGKTANSSLEQLRQLLKGGPTGISLSPGADSRDSFFDVSMNAIAHLGVEGSALLPEVMDALGQLDPIEEIGSMKTDGAGGRYLVHRRLPMILKVLTAMGPASSPTIPLLSQRMNELHYENQLPIVKTLLDLRCEPGVVVPVLVKLLANSLDHPTETLGSSFEIGATLYQASADDARGQIESIIKRLRSDETQINRAALFVLEGMAPVAQEAVPTIIPLLGHTRREFREDAFRILVPTCRDHSDLISKLISQLENVSADSDYRVIEGALLALGEIGPSAKDSIPLILKIVEDPAAFVQDTNPVRPTFFSDDFMEAMSTDERLRFLSILSIGKIGETTSEVTTLLRNQLSSESASCRAAACKGVGTLVNCPERYLVDLIRLLDDESELVRVEASLAIGRLNEDRRSAVRPLEHCLSDTVLYVRAAAAHALGQIGEDAKIAIPTLKELFEDPKNSDTLSIPNLFAFIEGGVWRNPQVGSRFESVLQTARLSLRSIDPDTAPRFARNRFGRR